MGVEPYLVASVLEGVLAQRLVRRICQACRVPDAPIPADLDALGVADAGGAELFRGKGCDECRGTGYRGRTGIYELFRSSTRTRAASSLRRASGRARSATTPSSAAWSRCGWTAGPRRCAGVTTVEEILRVTQEDA